MSILLLVGVASYRTFGKTRRTVLLVFISVVCPLLVKQPLAREVPTLSHVENVVILLRVVSLVVALGETLPITTR